MNYTVYLHKNLKNQKVYIGQTSQSVQKRWNNGKGYVSSPHFYAAIQKYGWNNFEHIILKEKLTAEEADYWEKYYISLYQSQQPEKGYNILSGGNEKLKEYWSDENNRKNQSLKRKQYFKNHPEEIKEIVDRLNTFEINEKHRLFMKNNYNTSFLKQINEKRKIQVLCIETGKVFDSLVEASKFYNISVGNISSVLSGKRKTAGGYHWKRVENQ